MASLPLDAPKKVIFLSGSPNPNDLKYEEEFLTSTLNFRVRRFLGSGVPFSATEDTSSPDASSLALPRWRLIPTSPHVKLKVSKKDADPVGMNLRPADLTESDDFSEHSLAVILQLQPSQLDTTGATPIGTSANLLDTSIVTTTSTDEDQSYSTSTSTSAAIIPDSFAAPTPPHLLKHLIALLNRPTRPLLSLPSTTHVASIYPQTITVNLLVGIISVKPPRTVRLRRQRPNGTTEMDIIEVIVGDETRAGCIVNFWLDTPPGRHEQIAAAAQDTTRPSSETEQMRETLQILRPGSITLLSNIALSTYRGVVYGQSLSARITWNHTKIAILDAGIWPHGHPPHDVGPQAAFLANQERFTKVRGWVEDFVLAQDGSVGVAERDCGEGLASRGVGGTGWEGKRSREARVGDDCYDTDGVRPRKRVAGHVRDLPPDSQ